MRFPILLPAALAFGLIASIRPVTADDNALRAGAVAQDITPSKFPISVNGNMRDVQAKGAHDRLHARCLVFDDGTTTIAIVVCDSCMIPREIFDEAKRLVQAKTGIPAHHMLMSATHTHEAPTVGGVFQSEPDADYVKELPKLIAAGVEKAFRARVPAKIGWAVGQNPTQLFNRRWKMKLENIPADPFGGTTDRVRMNPGYKAIGLIEPAGPIDPDVSILAVQTKDGKPLALLANYSLHYVGGVEPLSADYFGAFAERIGQLLQADKSFVGIMSNATSGDINNVNFAGDPPGKRQPYEQIKIVADSVARTAHAAYQTIRFREHVTLAMAESEIELGVRRPSADEVVRAEGILAKAKTPLTTLPEVYARETVLMAKYPGTVKAKLQAMRIGELGVCAIPCEVFAEIGLDLKKRSPLKPTCTIELANGYNGYLPTPKQHSWGGYETWRARSSYLEVDASTKITTTLLDLLAKVAK